MGSSTSNLKGSPPPPLVRLGSSEAVADLLSSRAWQSLNSASQGVKGGALAKLDLIAAAKLPSMNVISASRLRELGRFPANREGEAVDARKVLRQPGAVVALFSHRWLRPTEGLPDDESGSKVRALLEFARWYELKYEGRALHFWVDYCSIAWDNRALGIAALPAYVAACNDIVIFSTADYFERAWCRLELSIAYTFTFAGEVPWVINASLGDDDSVGSEHEIARSSMLLLDPAEGNLTVASDRVHIESLLAVAHRSAAAVAWGGAPRRLVFAPGDGSDAGGRRGGAGAEESTYTSITAVALS